MPLAELVEPSLDALPFKIGDSVRLLDPTMPAGSTAPGFDPITGNPITVTNTMTNFGWEYVWHCHLLGHEENDMMRPMEFLVSPAAPSGLTATPGTGPVVALAWTDNATNPAATDNLIQRATDAGFTQNVTTVSIAGAATSYSDSSVAAGTTYYYRVRAENAISYSVWTDAAQAIVP